MGEQELLKVLLDSGSFLSLDDSKETGITAGLGCILSRPVSVITFSQYIKSAAEKTMLQLIEKAGIGGTPLLLVFSDKETTDKHIHLDTVIKRIVRLSGVCPILALVADQEGDIAQKLLPYTDFCIFASGLHALTASHLQVPDAVTAVERMRSLLSYLPLNCAENAPVFNSDGKKLSKKTGVLPTHSAVLQCISDSASVLTLYNDTHSILAFSRVHGKAVGILSSATGAFPAHAARFVQFCDCYSLPVIVITEQALCLDNMQTYMLARATMPMISIGNVGGYAAFFDMSITIEGLDAEHGNTVITMQDAYDTVSHALMLLSVKRDILPPHKHGNLPLDGGAQ
ncbi:MAG: hypothetical protein II343_04940 [Clostridia bacterium]|nr:hypothetical protein [Clostridia bacterium]